MTSIKGLSSAFPKHKVFQDDVKALGRKIFFFHLKPILKKWKRFMTTLGLKLGISPTI